MKQLVILAGGILFGFGLDLSRMTHPEVVLSFLQLEDLGLLFVMGGAVAVAVVAYHLIPKLMKRPALAPAYVPRPETLSWKVVAGAAVFGLGWGLAGLCPGSALASLGAGNYPVLLGLAAMFAGAYLRGRLLD
jgi:uncharacterized membrane protein YedE/YeeE